MSDHVYHKVISLKAAKPQYISNIPILIITLIIYSPMFEIC